MKRKYIAMSALLATLLAGGLSSVQAGGPMGMGGGPCGGKNCGCRSQRHCDETQGPLGRLDRMAEVLGLSDSQRQEIEGIITAEREKNAPLREQIAAGREELRQLARSGEVDEAKLAALADAQAKLMSELMVSRVQVRSQIYALLTPEQQKQADSLGGGWGMGPGCGLGGGRNCPTPATGDAPI